MKVKIYTSSSCAFCEDAKRFLERHGVDFDEIDVSSEEAAHELVEKSGQRGVPVIDVDGTVLVGFNPHALQHALGIEHGH